MEEDEFVWSQHELQSSWAGFLEPRSSLISNTGPQSYWCRPWAKSSQDRSFALVSSSSKIRFSACVRGDTCVVLRQNQVFRKFRNAQRVTSLCHSSVSYFLPESMRFFEKISFLILNELLIQGWNDFGGNFPGHEFCRISWTFTCATRKNSKTCFWNRNLENNDLRKIARDFSPDIENQNLAKLSGSHPLTCSGT